jgi:murein L,D-transpeptidase YafK
MRVAPLFFLISLSLAVTSGLFVTPSSVAASTKADKVLVLKEERKLFLLRDGHVIEEFDVALGINPKGHKVFQGDGRTPEGTYRLTFKNENSRFHRSIRISYPNAEDKALAQRFGIPPGGDIMIHGQPNPRHGEESATKDSASSIIGGDWTEGCIAVSNAEMDRIWAKIDSGTPIEIRP